MMTVLMSHPEHGKMYVYSPLELEQSKERGWSPVPDDLPVVPPSQHVETAVKRRGRPAKGSH